MSTYHIPDAPARPPAEITPEMLTAVVDTREQHALDLSPLKTISGTLTTGDYSLRGLESVIAIERKSLGDLLGCIGRDRERFEREIQRLLAFPVRCLAVESSWDQIEAGRWRSKITPRQVEGSLYGWMAAGLPVVLAGDHDRAGRVVARMLFIAARRRWQENRHLSGSVKPRTRATGKRQPAGGTT